MTTVNLLPLRIALNPKFSHPILGATDTVRTKCGHVVLAVGESMGRHTTGEREEIIIVLEGVGRFNIDGHCGLWMGPDSVLYCPPDMFHSVENAGDSVLRYVYIVTGERP